MRRWMVAAALVLAACGSRSGLIPGAGGTSSASGGTSGTGASSLGGGNFGGTGGSAFGGTGGSAFGGTGGSAFGGSGFGGSGGTPSLGGSPGSGGSGGTPPACNLALCPSSVAATSCCRADGSCGMDWGQGCGPVPSVCQPPAPGAVCDQISSGIATCDACMQANCCAADGACFTNVDCVSLAKCAIQHACVGQPNPDLGNCLLKYCKSYEAGGLQRFMDMLSCGRFCCDKQCP